MSQLSKNPFCFDLVTCSIYKAFNGALNGTLTFVPTILSSKNTETEA